MWGTGKNGCAYWRVGIRSDNLNGDNWACVEPPNGTQLMQISVGRVGVWAIDTSGRLHVRKEVTSVFPEGTHWQCIEADPTVTSKFHY